ncbi:MAG: hypothetical protein EOL90_00090 [Spartobacteria bacterium]|nr:hypothetical protein [Spartobacteria bacterium]
MNLPISKIVADGGIQTREGTNPATVNEYADAMQDGAAFPPVVVFHDGTQYFLADGFHRVAAAESLDWKEIEADVREGGRLDALWFALSANKAHGARMTRADVRKAIGLALQEFPERSNRDIGKQIGCDHKTVEAARRVHEAGGEIPHVENRTGADGKTYPARREPEPEAVETESSEPDAEPDGTEDAKPEGDGEAEAEPTEELPEDESGDDAEGKPLPTYNAVVRANNIASAKKRLASAFGPGAVVSVEKQTFPKSKAERLGRAEGFVEDAKSIVEELLGEIESRRDNMPENLQNGETADRLSECADGLQSIVDALGEVDFSSIEFPGAFGQ